MAITSRQTAALVLITALASIGTATHAQPQQPEQARVISSTPSAQGGYTVTYEYAGRRYTTRTDTAPGPTLPIQVGALGVTTRPVHSSTITANDDPPAPSGQPWQNVVPEPGVVVSGGDVGVPGYGPQPIYVQPAPIYVQPSYVYPPPFYFPPVGLSLNFGYARGWGGGWHRGWR